jgi:hypothetical protein
MPPLIMLLASVLLGLSFETGVLFFSPVCRGRFKNHLAVGMMLILIRSFSLAGIATICCARPVTLADYLSGKCLWNALAVVVILWYICQLAEAFLTLLDQFFPATLYKVQQRYIAIVLFGMVIVPIVGIALISVVIGFYLGMLLTLWKGTVDSLDCVGFIIGISWVPIFVCVLRNLQHFFHHPNE